MNIKRISITLFVVGMIAALVTSAYTANADDGRRKLVGTWICDVAGEPSFHALQTFHAERQAYFYQAVEGNSEM